MRSTRLAKSIPEGLAQRLVHHQSATVSEKQCRIAVFTALHGMQTRSSDENSVCPSVRLSVCPSVKRVDCDKTKEKCVPIILRKII